MTKRSNRICEIREKTEVQVFRKNTAKVASEPALGTCKISSKARTVCVKDIKVRISPAEECEYRWYRGIFRPDEFSSGRFLFRKDSYYEKTASENLQPIRNRRQDL